MLKKYKNQEVYFGEAGSARYLKDKLTEWQSQRILFITGKDSFFRSGAEAFFKEADVEVRFRFSEFEANPTCMDLLSGLKYFETVKPDCIVAAGGGSVMDMAKLINFFGVNKINPEEYLESQTQPVPGGKLRPCIAIPTTAGTGSEATHFSVLYKDKVKYSVANVRMVPDAVILNPVLTAQMSTYQTACTGMDALAQGIESWWAVGATEESREYAEKAMRLAWANLEKAVKKPDAKSRQKMQEAAYWAGRAINISKTTAAHAMSYPLTSYYGYPHGHAVALLLPIIYKVHLERGFVPKKLTRLLGDGPAEDTVVLLERLNSEIGLGLQRQFTLKDIEVVLSSVNVERLENNPGYLNTDDMRVILTQSLILKSHD